MSRVPLLRIWFSGPSFDTSFPYIGLQVLFKWACVCIGLQIRFDLMGTLKRPIPGGSLTSAWPDVVYV